MFLHKLSILIILIDMFGLCLMTKSAADNLRSVSWVCFSDIWCLIIKAMETFIMLVIIIFDTTLDKFHFEITCDYSNSRRSILWFWFTLANTAANQSCKIQLYIVVIKCSIHYLYFAIFWLLNFISYRLRVDDWDRWSFNRLAFSTKFNHK